MKNLVVVLVLIFIISLISLGYIVYNLSKNGKLPQTNTQKVQPGTKSKESTQALKDLLSQNNQVCKIDNKKYVGVIKINNENINSTLTYKGSSKTYNNIIVGNTMYSWEKGTKNGVKITKDKSKPALEKEFTNTTKPFIEDKSVKCTFIRLGKAEFTPPSEINFISINSLVGN